MLENISLKIVIWFVWNLLLEIAFQLMFIFMYKKIR